ncbi:MULTISPECIES: hypothetical protein [unclassified Actinoplanes]|uniref:hypothetical protein n=1 Tax=unclassified Actinoplanes TaxID=2626549 RepID=UPI0002E1F3E8|nr:MULTISPECIES: hypothetical protein [unclassified Actinoplanes]
MLGLLLSVPSAGVLGLLPFVPPAAVLGLLPLVAAGVGFRARGGAARRGVVGGERPL